MGIFTAVPGRLLCVGQEEPLKEVNTSYKQISNVESQWWLRLSPPNQLTVYTAVNHLEETLCKGQDIRTIPFTDFVIFML